MNLLLAILLVLAPAAYAQQTCTSWQGDTVLPGTVVNGACIPLPWPPTQRA